MLAFRQQDEGLKRHTKYIHVLKIGDKLHLYLLHNKL